MKRPRPEEATEERKSPQRSLTGQATNGGGAAATATASPPSRAAVVPKLGSRYKYAMVCSSNINRSMEAHVALLNQRLRVNSYGAGRQVRLPVPGGGEGRSFAFGTPYQTMYNTLTADLPKYEEFYKKTRLLDILKRNMLIKPAPERWQDEDPDVVCSCNVVVCFEQRIFDSVIEDLQSREPKDLNPICVICLETKDDPKEAVVAGRLVLKLAQQLEGCEDLSEAAPEVVEKFQEDEDRRLLYQICYL